MEENHNGHGPMEIAVQQPTCCLAAAVCCQVSPRLIYLLLPQIGSDRQPKYSGGGGGQPNEHRLIAPYSVFPTRYTDYARLKPR